MRQILLLSCFAASIATLGTSAAIAQGIYGVSPTEARKLMEVYKDLSPAEKKQLREHADELKQLTPEERAWALENKDTVRQLGAIPDSDRDELLKMYKQLPPEEQRALRGAVTGP